MACTPSVPTPPSGSRSPAYASATGKALLCWQDEAEIARVGASAQDLTGSTHVGREDLLQHARETRAAGYAVNRGEWRKGVWGVAAPVFGRGTVPVAAIGVSGPQERIEPQIEPFSVIVRAGRPGPFRPPRIPLPRRLRRSRASDGSRQSPASAVSPRQEISSP